MAFDITFPNENNSMNLFSQIGAFPLEWRREAEWVRLRD